jgi:hemerythrin-like domain-containing protein
MLQQSPVHFLKNAGPAVSRHDDGLVLQIGENHKTLLALCAHLEDFADALPDAVDRQECLIMSRALGPMIHRIQEFEESQVFPILLAWQAIRPEMTETIDRLKIEHQLDSCYAEDVQDMLRGLGEGRPTLSPDAAGFMLRGFFEAMRRHVAFEQQFIVPLLALAMQHVPLPAGRN